MLGPVYGRRYPLVGVFVFAAMATFSGGGCQCQPFATGGDGAGDGGTIGQAGGNDGGQVARDAGVGDAAGAGDAAAPLDGGNGQGNDAAMSMDAGADAGGLPGVDAGTGTQTCVSCHGSDTPAPPMDTRGGWERTLTGVGAHRAHLRNIGLYRETACEECHLVPATVDAPGHVDTRLPAELTWGTIATARDVQADFDGVTCTTYCHGETLGGGTITRPEWTKTAQAFCGSCHGVPPPPPHPAVPINPPNCGGCHPFNGMVPQDSQRHVDGILDVSVSCTSCHGNDVTGPAPPRDTHGQQETTLTTVGAHASHLGPSTWHAEVSCTQCHKVPASVGAPDHMDGDGVAEVSFGALANARGANSNWDGTTCSTYCHGQTLSTGALTEPTWVTVDGTQAVCGNCHGLPPTANGHPDNTECSRCHSAVVNAAGGFVNPDLHINGQVDVTVGCTGCHGNDVTGPAPPSDTHGNIDPSLTTVGAHQAHLGPSDWHLEVTCSECHRVPSEVGAPDHLDGDGVAEVTLGGVATANGVTGSWDGTTCATYCHGATLSGGDAPAPIWTSQDGTQADCGSCHGLPPVNGHPSGTQCSQCHGSVVNAANVFVNPDLHINGLVDTSAVCGDCHGLPPATGAHLLHAGLAAATYGGLGTAADLAQPTGYAMGCGQCHPRNVSHHLNGGLAEVELYDATAPAGSLKALNPSTATYVQGGTQFTDNLGRIYTTGTCSNVYCHSGMQTATGAIPQPGVDFPSAGYPVVYPMLDITRSRTYQTVAWGDSLTCNGCHGYPPRGESPGVQAAAGESHAFLRADGYEDMHIYNHGFAPVPCRTCHAATVTQVATFTRDAMGVTSLGPLPRDGFASHVNGAADVVFDRVNPVTYPGTAGPVTMDLSGAVYNPAAGTCSNVACHFQQTTVTFGTPYRPENATECNACHQF